MNTDLTDAALNIKDDKPAPTNYLTVAMELYVGGNWLGACRRWMQSNLPRGDQITWGDEDQRFELTPKQIESLAYRVAVAAVNADRSQQNMLAGKNENKPIIHFVLDCVAALQECGRRRHYHVDVFASSLQQAREAYYEQTRLYEVGVDGVVDAVLCDKEYLAKRPEVVSGLASHNGAFLLEQTKDW